MIMYFEEIMTGEVYVMNYRVGKSILNGVKSSKLHMSLKCFNSSLLGYALKKKSEKFET